MSSKNKLYVHDNLDVLHGMNSNSVDLIYLDPPFNSKRIYVASIGSAAEKKASKKGKTASFDDIWAWNEDVDIRLESLIKTHSGLFAYIDVVGEIHGLAMKAYLTFMAQRIIEMHRVLKDTGSIYLHCDPTASHYLKLILDLLFGKHNFRNEIVWSYRTGGSSKKHFSRKHDVLFMYSKTKDCAFNIIKEKAYTKSMGRKPGIVNYGAGTAEFLGDSNGVYNLVNMRDVWEIPYLGSTDKERTGYPTQKPLALLDRIIKASSNEGDLVLDPFCGCATTCVAAQNLHRNWIGIDISEVAGDLIVDRLSIDEDGDNAQSLLFTDFEISKTPPVRNDLEKLTWSKDNIRKTLYGEQAGKCAGCSTHFEIQHFEIDHIYPESKGGAWQMDNLQLLCGSCNRIKGDRPMEFLLARLRERRKQDYAY